MTIQDRIDHATEALSEFSDTPAMAIAIRQQIALELARLETVASAVLYHTEALWLHRIVESIGFEDEATEMIVMEAEAHIKAGVTVQQIIADLVKEVSWLGQEQDTIEQLTRQLSILLRRWAEFYEAGSIQEGMSNKLTNH